MNEIIWFIFLIVCFLALIGFYYFFGLLGLYIWICLATVLANIQVSELIYIFGFQATLGNIFYGSLFLSTNILSENHSYRSASISVVLGFLVLALTSLFMYITHFYHPSHYDTAHQALNQIFGFFPRLLVASLCAYLFSRFYNVLIYKLISPVFSQLWIKNIIASVSSQVWDTLIFCTIAFLGMHWWLWMQIFISTFFIKALVSILGTPCLYWAKKLKNHRFPWFEWHS